MIDCLGDYMKKITELFNINKGDIVSIVGSGGKTTFLFQLAKGLRNEYKVLASTSTRILEPPTDDYDYLYTDIESYIINKNLSRKNSITVISKSINTETKKLIGIDDNDLDILINDFDVILLEADGSRNLPLKGWKDHEPPVLNKTNKTIGVIPANLINKKASNTFIYGFDEFNILTGFREYISFEAIGKICSSNNGLFKNSKGSLYLFLNKADTKEEIQISKELSKYLKEFAVNNPFDFKICFGSLEKEVYYEC